MAEGLIDDVQGGFREGRRYVDQIFTLKQIGEKAWEKICKEYVGFMDLEKAHDRVNREPQWQVLRMYDAGGKLLNDIKKIYVNRHFIEVCRRGLMIYKILSRYTTSYCTLPKCS